MIELGNESAGRSDDHDRVVWAQDAAVHFAYPFLDEFERVLGDQELGRFLAGWGVTVQELRRDKSRWISLPFLEALADELERLTGSTEVVARCGRLGMTRPYVGPIFSVMQVFGSPGGVYKALPRLSGSVNKVNRVEVEPLGRGRALITYHPGEPQERSRNVCIARRAQLGVVPAVWPDFDSTC